MYATNRLFVLERSKMMSIFSGAEIAEIRIYDNPSNPEASAYKVVLPITLLEAVVDPNTGESLDEILTRTYASLGVNDDGKIAFDDTEPLPTNDNASTGTLTQTLGRFANVIKQITGQADWWKPPTVSLEKADTKVKSFFTCGEILCNSSIYGYFDGGLTPVVMPSSSVLLQGEKLNFSPNSYAPYVPSQEARLVFYPDFAECSGEILSLS